MLSIILTLTSWVATAMEYLTRLPNVLGYTLDALVDFSALTRFFVVIVFFGVRGREQVGILVQAHMILTYECSA